MNLIVILNEFNSANKYWSSYTERLDLFGSQQYWRQKTQAYSVKKGRSKTVQNL